MNSTSTSSDTVTEFDHAGFDHGGVTLNRPSGVKCPSCRCEMEIGEVQSAQFVGCPECKGMMFQLPVFARLVGDLRNETKSSKMPEPINLNELKVRRICPTCGSVMETHAFCGPGNSVIDTCSPCGVIFLDQGELAKLVVAPGR